jgi:hypothetical protein
VLFAMNITIIDTVTLLHVLILSGGLCNVSRSILNCMVDYLLFYGLVLRIEIIMTDEQLCNSVWRIFIMVVCGEI